jgi:Ner family transcriptional regulator
MHNTNQSQRRGWHPEDIKAAIRKKRKTLSQLSLDNGYNVHAVRQALRRPWPNVERIIGEFLGVAPSVLWPDRYEDFDA